MPPTTPLPVYTDTGRTSSAHVRLPILLLLVRAADRALYQAKADGRDRVVAAAHKERVSPPSTASVSPVT